MKSTRFADLIEALKNTLPVIEDAAQEARRHADAADEAGSSLLAEKHMKVAIAFDQQAEHIRQLSDATGIHPEDARGMMIELVQYMTSKIPGHVIVELGAGFYPFNGRTYAQFRAYSSEVGKYSETFDTPDEAIGSLVATREEMIEIKRKQAAKLLEEAKALEAVS